MNRAHSVLAALAMTVGAAAVAGAQQPAPTQAPGQHGQHGRMMRPGGGERALLRGLTLSDGEKANLKAVHEKYASQLKALRQQDRPQLQADRKARQSGDSAAMGQLRQQRQADRRQLMQVMKAERADERAALSPANQTKFDANVTKLDQRMASQRGRNGGRRNGAPGVPPRA